MSEALPASFGDVTAEYQALHDGAGLVAGAYELVWVEGPDAVTFLDGQVTQDVAAVTPGAVARSLLLEPRGKMIAAHWLLRDDEAVGIVVDAGRAGVVIEALNRFRFRVNATVGPEVTPLLGLWGGNAVEVLQGVGLPEPAGWSRHGDGLVVRAPTAFPGFVVAGIDPDALTAAGAHPVGVVAWTTVRIEMGEPVSGVDVDESTIPQESGLVDDAVSFTKGCYLGQELVARIDSRGRVNRHLRGLAVTENLIPPLGAEVTLGDRDLGTVTSVGESLRVGAPIAMALLRREAEPGATVAVTWEGGSTTAVVRELPMVEK